MPMSNPHSDLTLECLVHDLNNVFQTLLEAADLLASDPQWASLSGTIVRSVERGSSLTQSLIGPEPGLVDLNAAIEKAAQFAEDFIATALGSRVSLGRDLAPDVWVRGTSAVWERVFVNLFLNAAQAMPEGGCVRVVSKSEDEMVQIVVSDDGPGIPIEILPEIFKPRFSTSAGRTGLGLHIVATIVTKHLGTVTATNQPDSRGAVFTISIPCHPESVGLPLFHHARA